ncbi:TonB-dependent receptor [Marinilabiliaceae bacterium JC017]|nr:TonB-dependent receptor [Marinilabiliaceae bacterium JC017]
MMRIKNYKRYMGMLLLVFSTLAGAQQTIEVKGFVYDQVRKIPLEACNVKVVDEAGNLRGGAITDHKGLFSMPVNQTNDSLQLVVTHVIYESGQLPVSGLKDGVYNMYLIPRVYTIQDVTVCSAYSSDNKGNQFVYTPMEAASSISIIGEPDVVRHISSMPGVAQGMEGTLGLFVRGANNGSNRIVFNQVPIYSFSHLIGLFSAFAPDVIEKTSFRPGGIPAAAGNLSSSLIQITPKMATCSPFGGKVTVSPYMTGGYLSLPVKKDELSVQVAARTSFLPWAINRFMQGEDEMKASVVDVTSIVDWRINATNRMDLMFYLSDDYFDFKDAEIQSKQNWGTRVFKLGWHGQLSSRLQWSAWAYYNHTYAAQEQINFDQWGMETDVQADLKVGSQLDEYALNARFDYQISTQLSALGGVEYQHQRFMPSVQKMLLHQNENSNYEQEKPVDLLSAHGQLNYEKSGKYKLMAGFRQGWLTGEQYHCTNFDLHLLADVYLLPEWGMELTYEKLTQYFHVMEGMPTGWSFNVLAPADQLFPEEVTRQGYGGFFWQKRLHEILINATLGGYYRHMDNLVSYKSTVNMFGITDATWNDEVALGEGESYGLEASGMIQGKRLGATMAYTLSKAERLFPEMNKGEVFPFKFDRRHMLNLQSKYEVVSGVNRKGKKRQQYCNVVLAWSTGHRATMPIGTYQGLMPPYWDQRQKGHHFPHEVDDNAYHRQQMTPRNGYKMEDYLRLDVAYTFVRHRKKSTRELSFSIFNVLNRHNPYLYLYDDDQWQQLSIAPIMPSVRWSLRF